jgi:hypothetical protein
MQPETASKLKGLSGAEVAKAAELVNYQDGAVVSREIVKKPTGNVTIFAFDEGQGLSVCVRGTTGLTGRSSGLSALGRPS